MPRKNRNIFFSVEAGILLLALILRFWGLANGLPDATHPDENLVVRRALHFGSGDFNPHFFYYPSFAMYVFSLLDGIYFVGGLFLGLFHSSSDLARSFISDPTAFYLIARVFIALVDTITCWMLVRLGSDYFGKTAGRFAALLWAVFPQVIVDSQVGKPDALMLCLALGALIILNDATEFKRCAWAGVVLGLSVSAKYQSALLGLPLLILILRTSSEVADWKKNAVAFCSLMALGFFIGSPFVLLDHHQFLNDFLAQMEVMKTGSFGTRGDPSRGWGYYAMLMLNPEGSPFVGVLVLIGVVWGSRRFREKIFLLTGTLLLIYLTLGHHRVFGPHYFLIGYPFLFLLAAGGAESLFLNSSRTMKFIGALLITMAFIPYARGAFLHARGKTELDTRTAAREWITTNIPAGSTLLVDPSVPPLPMSREQLTDLLSRARAAHHIKAELFQLKLQFAGNDGYRIYLSEQPTILAPKRLVDYSRQVQDLIPIEKGLAWVKSQGIQYVVESSGEADNYRRPENIAYYTDAVKFYDDLDTKAKLLAEFRTSPTRPGVDLRIYQLD